MDDVWATFQEEAGLLEDTIDGIRQRLEEDNFDSVTLEMYQNRIQEICMSRVDDDMTCDGVFTVYCDTFEELGIRNIFIRNYFIERFYTADLSLSLLILGNSIRNIPVPINALGVSEIFTRLRRIASTCKDKKVLWELSKVVISNVRYVYLINKRTWDKDKMKRITRAHFGTVGLSRSEYENEYIDQINVVGKLDGIDCNDKGYPVHPGWKCYVSESAYYSEPNFYKFDKLSSVLTNKYKRGDINNVKDLEVIITEAVDEYATRYEDGSKIPHRCNAMFGDLISVVARSNRIYGSKDKAVRFFSKKYGVELNEPVMKGALDYVRVGYVDMRGKYDYDDLEHTINSDIVKILDHFEDNGRDPYWMKETNKAFWFDDDGLRVIFRDFSHPTEPDRVVIKRYKDCGIEDGYIASYEIKNFISKKKF